MILRRSIVAVTLALALPAAADLTWSEKVKREIPMRIGGTFVLQNTAGDIEIIGTDEPKIVFVAEKLVRGGDKAAIEEGKQQTQIAIGENARAIIVRTLVPNLRNGWASGMNYIVRVPRTAQIKVTSLQATRIRIAGMRNNVNVKSGTGVVTIDDVTGPALVDSANGRIVFNAPAQGLSDAQLTSVNGDVEVRVPQNARFQWIAQVFQGDARTTFRVTPSLINNRYVATVNGIGGPTITTQSFTGDVALLQSGAALAAARSIRSGIRVPEGLSPRQFERRDFTTTTVRGLFHFEAALGDVTIGSIHGGADITTGAGEIQLGSVFGPCQVISGGGPLTLGQIMGGLLAKTEAGDVSIELARQGGTITTGGGTIRLTATGGPTRLQSGGGDIVVRQADGPVSAETQSGDITITMDPSTKTERITAKTAKGNVQLYVPPAFAADIDATVITSDPEVHRILSDLAGLAFRREQVGGKTKIRATGKVNGGGGRVELYAEDGGIQITARSGPPVAP